MNRRSAFLVAVLFLAGALTVSGAFSKAPAQAARKAVNLATDNPQLPFSGAIQAGNTLYLAGRIGIDPKTGKPPAEIDAEIKLVLDNIKDTLAQAGMTMDDLVNVQIFCSDLALYDKFNAAYRGYFTTKELPARAFIGTSVLLRGGHFEVLGIAVKR